MPRRRPISYQWGLHHVFSQSDDKLFRWALQSPVQGWITKQIQLRRSLRNSRGMSVMPTCSIASIKLTNTSSPPCYSHFTVAWKPNVFELWLDTPTHCTQSTSFIRQQLLLGGKVELNTGIGSHNRCICSPCLWLHHRCFTPSQTLRLHSLISPEYFPLNIYERWSAIVPIITQSFVDFSYTVMLCASVCFNVYGAMSYKLNMNPKLTAPLLH